MYKKNVTCVNNTKIEVRNWRIAKTSLSPRVLGVMHPRSDTRTRGENEENKLNGDAREETILNGDVL